MGEHKIFADFVEVECNDCSRYWDSSCDGVSEGLKKPCNSFLANRSVSIPHQIEALQRANVWLRGAVVLLALAQIFHIVGG